MARVVSGFKKNKRPAKSAFALAFVATRAARRFLSMEIGQLPSFRRAKPSQRPQTYLKRDIHKKRLGNPYSKEPWYHRFWQNIIVANRFGIAATSLAVLMFAWWYVVFIKPTFYIKRTAVYGAEEINSEEIEQLALSHMENRSWLFVKRGHRLFLGLDGLRETITERYDLEFLRFEPDWTASQLTITLKEKPSVFTYSLADRYFAVDKEGIIIRELPADAERGDLPVIYEYDGASVPAVGQPVLTANFIASIIRLQQGFAAYPEIEIHSFRLRTSPQRQITIVDEPPQTDEEKTAKNKTDDKLEAAAESIAQAKTIDEKVRELQAAIENLSIERLEEGKLDQLLKEQRVYAPKEGFAYKELEIYTKQGWSIKVGHDVFEDATNAEHVLNIFATLNGAVNLKEVREYIDLRVPNRVYYR